MTVWVESDHGEMVVDKWADRAFARASAWGEREATASSAAAGQEERNYGGPWGPYADGTIPPPSWDGGTIDGSGSLGIAPMNEQRALQHASVTACISLHADTVMQTPMRVYRKTKLGLEEVEPPQIVADPNPELFDFDVFHQVSESLIGGGNSYNRILEVDRLGFPTSILPIHPDNMRVTRNRATGRRQYEILPDDGYVRSPEPLLADGASRELVHIPAFTVPGSLTGLNRMQKAMVTIYGGLAAEQFAALYFRDAANPSSILSTKEDLDSEHVKEAQKEWIRSHRGRRLPAVLSGGWEWKPIGITPEESQFLATIKASDARIAKWWRCPPHMIGDVEKSTSWGKGIEEQTLGYIVFGANPYYVRIERAWSSMLGKQYICKFDTAELLRGRTLDRYQAYVHARNAGWLAVNEIRKKEGLLPVPDGDQLIQPLNMGPIGVDPTAIDPNPKHTDDPTDPTEPTEPDGDDAA